MTFKTTEILRACGYFLFGAVMCAATYYHVKHGSMIAFTDVPFALVGFYLFFDKLAEVKARPE